MSEGYEPHRNQWIKLSGSDLWHRISTEPGDAALCGNPSTGIVLSATTTDLEPPGPKCPDCLAAEPRGRVYSRELLPGERYFAVYSPTGVCVYRTRSEVEAQEVVAKKPDKLSYMEHTKPGERPANADHHRVSVEAQTWGNTPPYPANTMYRAFCTCGWRGVWHFYEENVVKRCPNV